MGIYVIAMERLEKLLTEDAANPKSSATTSARTSFRRRSPNLRVFAYPFQDVETRAQSYWRDVGNVDAFYEANMELVALNPELNIYDQQWPIWTYQAQQPPAKFVLDEDGRRGMAVNSMVSGGCIISGAYVTRVAAVDRRAHRGGQQHRELRASAGRQRRPPLPDPALHHGRALRDPGRHADRPRSCTWIKQRFYVTKRGVVLVTPDMLKALT